MNTPTASHAQVAADALAAASDPGFSFGFGPSMEEVRAKFQALAEGWDREGWTATTIRLFAEFMDAARSRASERAWTAANLDARRYTLGEEIRDLPFDAGSDPVIGETPFSLPNPIHDVMWIMVALAVVAGAVVYLTHRR